MLRDLDTVNYGIVDSLSRAAAKHPYVAGTFAGPESVYLTTRGRKLLNKHFKSPSELSNNAGFAARHPYLTKLGLESAGSLPGLASMIAAHAIAKNHPDILHGFNKRINLPLTIAGGLGGRLLAAHLTKKQAEEAANKKYALDILRSL